LTDYKEFKAILEDHYADWSTPLNNPKKWYADDVLVFDLLPPFVPYRSSEEYVAGVQKEFYNKMSEVKFTAKDILRVTQMGDMVLTEVIVHGSAKQKNGGKLELDVRQTQVWVRRNGKWLIVHEHNSVPMMPPK